MPAKNIRSTYLMRRTLSWGRRLSLSWSGVKGILAACVFLALPGGFACKKVIHVDLHNAVSQIVIEGELTDNQQQPSVVKISRTVDFQADNTFPPVSGATVILADSSTGHAYTLSETSPGTYTTTQLGGVRKHIYTMLVIADGREYRAVSVMPEPVPLDSVTFAQNTDFNNHRDINAVVNFQDPPGLGNDYEFIETLNGKLVPNIFVFEDRLSDGRYIQQPLFNDSSYLQKGDSLELQMYCVDKNVYNYLFTLMQVTGNNNFQSATPANPLSNISGGALGYFSAHTKSQEKLFVY